MPYFSFHICDLLFAYKEEKDYIGHFEGVDMKEKHIKIRIEQCLALSKAQLSETKIWSLVGGSRTKCHFNGWL